MWIWSINYIFILKEIKLKTFSVAVMDT
jgi:hypothetical protein